VHRNSNTAYQSQSQVGSESHSPNQFPDVDNFELPINSILDPPLKNHPSSSFENPLATTPSSAIQQQAVTTTKSITMATTLNIQAILAVNENPQHSDDKFLIFNHNDKIYNVHKEELWWPAAVIAERIKDTRYHPGTCKDLWRRFLTNLRSLVCSTGTPACWWPNVLEHSQKHPGKPV
jgi:hypothetical protein